MALVQTIKKSFKGVIDNPSIALFFVIFLIILNYSLTNIVTTQSQIAAWLFKFASVVLIVVFLSGWFEAIKHSFDIEKIKEKNYFSIFFEGVGKNIISVSISLIIYLFLFVLTLFIAQSLASYLFGNLDFLFKDLETLTDASSIKTYFEGLSTDKQASVYGWQFILIISFYIFYFLLLFYFPAMLCHEKENVFIKPFKGLYRAIKFVFKNFLGAFTLCILLYVSHFLIALIGSLGSSNAVLALVSLFIYIYFVSVSVMLIFNYYEEKTNCFNRADSFGENLISDKNSDAD